MELSLMIRIIRKNSYKGLTDFPLSFILFVGLGQE